MHALLPGVDSPYNEVMLVVISKYLLSCHNERRTSGKV